MTCRRMLVVGISALIALASCGGNDPANPSPSTNQTPSQTPQEASGTPASDYLADLCGAGQTWLSEIQARNQDLQEASSGASADALKDASVTYFSSLVDATESLIQSAEAAGVPDVEDGEQITNKVVAAFEAARSALQDSLRQVRALDTSDPAAFNSDLQAIGAGISTSFGEVAATMDSFGSPELDAAAADVPECA